jgi:hypothetical protein
MPVALDGRDDRKEAQFVPSTARATSWATSPWSPAALRRPPRRRDSSSIDGKSASSRRRANADTAPVVAASARLHHGRASRSRRGRRDRRSSLDERTTRNRGTGRPVRRKERRSLKRLVDGEAKRRARAKHDALGFELFEQPSRSTSSWSKVMTSTSLGQTRSASVSVAAPRRTASLVATAESSLEVASTVTRTPTS